MTWEVEHGLLVSKLALASDRWNDLQRAGRGTILLLWGNPTGSTYLRHKLAIQCTAALLTSGSD